MVYDEITIYILGMIMFFDKLIYVSIGVTFTFGLVLFLKKVITDSQIVPAKEIESLDARVKALLNQYFAEDTQPLKRKNLKTILRLDHCNQTILKYDESQQKKLDQKEKSKKK